MDPPVSEGAATAVGGERLCSTWLQLRLRLRWRIAGEGSRRGGALAKACERN